MGMPAHVNQIIKDKIEIKCTSKNKKINIKKTAWKCFHGQPIVMALNCDAGAVIGYVGP